MAKPDLGTKRVCQSCGSKFYDLSKDPITCPKCGAVYEIVVPVTRGGRPAAAAAAAAVPVAAAEDVEARADGAEVISLEDAEAESLGKKTKGSDPELDSEDDVEVDGDDEEDNTFLVTDEEEEGGDVSDIIGDGIDKEEEN